MKSRLSLKKILLLVPALLAMSIVSAQELNKANASPVNSSNNQLTTLMLIVMIVLAFVIWGMGRVLTELGRQVLDKKKSNGKIFSLILVLGFSLISRISFGQDAVTSGSIQVAPNYGGLSANLFYSFLAVLITEITVILFLAFSIKRVYTELKPPVVKKTTEPFLQLKSWWKKIDTKYFTKAIPVEREADLMLDHDYDGIRELDNSLPPWWKYGFFLTIVVAFIYLLNFHVLGMGKNPEEEYAAELDKAKIEREIYEAANKDRIDENNVPMPDAAGLAAAKEIFESKCSPCHGKLGEGGAGPNLTDEYWLHKGSLNDIYHTIKTGYPDKGMQSWEKVYSPKEISYLAGYIHSLQGSKPPNAKAPQGDIFIVETTTDSVTSKISVVQKN